jgi:O-antigen ligase
MIHRSAINMKVSTNKTCVTLISALAFTLPFADFARDNFGGLGLSVVVFPLILLILIHQQQANFKLSNDVWLYLTFLFCTTSSWLLSESFIGVFKSLLGYFLFFLIYDKVFINDRAIIKFLTCFMIGTVIVAALVLLDMISILNVESLLGRPIVYYLGPIPIATGFNTNPGGFATHFIFALPVMYYLILRSRMITRYIFILIFLMLSVVLILTYSRSAILGSIIACLIIHNSSRFNTYIFFKLITQLAAISAIIIFFIYILSFISSFDVQSLVLQNKLESINIRLRAFSTYFELLFQNPIFGIGYDNTKYEVERAIGLKINSHNIFFGIAIEYGFIAFIIFILLLSKAVFNVKDTIRRSNLDLQKRQLYGLVLGCLIGFLIHGLFHQIYVNSMFWLIILCSISVPKINKKALPHGGQI